jgi:hypothetical protein
MENLNGKEALQYLVGLGYEKEPIVKTELGLYTKENLARLKAPKASALEVSTLTGLVDYIKAKIDVLPEELLIHVETPTKVKLYSPLNGDRDREEFIFAKALLPDNIRFSKFLDTEDFNIMLQSSFVNKADKEILLKLTGLIKESGIKEIGDDGVSQAATIKTGVATVGDVKVPNPVTLAPYRTFPEIEQPESKFIFRMQSGPSAALFEADGGAWRNEAMESIKEYLTKSLEGLDNIKIIS